MKNNYIIIHQSWTKRNPDGSIKELGLKAIKHNQSYAEWNDEKNDWDYVHLPCNCELCKMKKYTE